MANKNDGKLVRIPGELHEKISEVTKETGQSIGGYVKVKIEPLVNKDLKDIKAGKQIKI